MTTDHIRYDLLAQDALRSVVRRVLTDAARDGLPGEHHFYISFKTKHPGVRLSSRLAEKYPDEITIVLQHQFWDLQVHEQSFEVGLSFGNSPEKLFVPFEAVSAFFDPSVQFGLKFEVQSEVDEQVAGTQASAPRPQIRGAASEPLEAPAGRRAEGKRSADGKLDEVKPSRTGKAGKAEGAKADDAKAAGTKPEGPKGGEAKPKSLKVVPDQEAASSDGEKKIVSLDTFRKKK